MDPGFEAAQLRLVARLARKHCLKHGEQPVFWSPATRTALAEAELEYADDHVSRAVFVSFPLLPGNSPYATEAGQKLAESFPNL